MFFIQFILNRQSLIQNSCEARNYIMRLIMCLVCGLLLLLWPSNENRYSATSGNSNRHTESFASLSCYHGKFCLFACSQYIKHHGQSVHGYLKPVQSQGWKCACVSILQARGLGRASAISRSPSTIANTHHSTRSAKTVKLMMKLPQNLWGS